MKTLLTDQANKDLEEFHNIFERSLEHKEGLEKELISLHKDAEAYASVPAALTVIGHRVGRLRAFIAAMMSAEVNLKFTHGPNCGCFKIGDMDNLTNKDVIN